MNRNSLSSLFRLQFATALLSVLLLTGAAPSMATEVNVYSARKEALIKPLLDRFTEESGIKVNLVTGKADTLLQRLKSEGRNSPADLLITTDAGRLHRAAEAGVLQPVESEALKRAVPKRYRAADNQWFGLSLRMRSLVYSRERVQLAQLSSYEDLSDPRWKGRLRVRSSNNIYNQSLVASMVAALGETETESWAKGLVENMGRPPSGGDRDQIKAVAAGQCDIALVNSYYYGRMVSSKKADEREAAAKTALFWANQGGRGVHVNVSGAAVTKASSHRENAVRLLEFLASDSSQAWYAASNYEYPVKNGLEIDATVASWGEFKADPLMLSRLGELNGQAIRITDRAGWR